MLPPNPSTFINTIVNLWGQGLIGSSFFSISPICACTELMWGRDGDSI